MEKLFPRKKYDIQYTTTSEEYVPKHIHQEIMEINQDNIAFRNVNDKKEYLNLKGEYSKLENKDKKLKDFVQDNNTEKIDVTHNIFIQQIINEKIEKVVVDQKYVQDIKNKLDLLEKKFETNNDDNFSNDYKFVTHIISIINNNNPIMHVKQSVYKEDTSEVQKKKSIGLSCDISSYPDMADIEISKNMNINNDNNSSENHENKNAFIITLNRLIKTYRYPNDLEFLYGVFLENGGVFSFHSATIMKDMDRALHLIKNIFKLKSFIRTYYCFMIYKRSMIFSEKNSNVEMV